MCGIAGIVERSERPIDLAAGARLGDGIAHRGPDGAGSLHRDHVLLLHARLAILDPSEAGAQPMHRHGCWLIHNGEIYNYVELAAELRSAGYEFTTGTDTEVILAAYEAWGTGAAARFNGMWAFALWDERAGRLWLSRDRMGVKPLYLRRAGTTVAFASEVSALVAAGPMHPDDPWRPEPNLRAVRDFLVRGLVDHSDHTFYAGIHALPAGHNLVIDRGGERQDRYWQVPELATDSTPPSAATAKADRARIAAFRDVFTESVRLRLRADVAIGTCLSGGMDSSAIVTTISHALRDRPLAGRRNEQSPRLAFHARYPHEGIDESRYAAMAAQVADMSLTFRSVGMMPFMERLDDLLRVQGEPVAGPSVFAQWTIMEAAHEQGLKVLLDGQGADELLGGYLAYVGVRLASLVRISSIGAAGTQLRASVRGGRFSAAGALRGLVRGAVPSWLNEAARRASRGAFGIRISDELRRHESLAREHHFSGTRLARRLWQDASHDVLPALLRYEDRNSMAFGIEARVPFLDYRLVEQAMVLPDRLKITDGVTKVILRDAMRGRVPSPIIDRRDKVGFATPQARWMTAAAGEAATVLSGGALVRRGWVEEAELDRILTQPSAGDGGLLWRLVSLERWMRLHTSWS